MTSSTYLNHLSILTNDVHYKPVRKHKSNRGSRCERRNNRNRSFKEICNVQKISVSDFKAQSSPKNKKPKYRSSTLLEIYSAVHPQSKASVYKRNNVSENINDSAPDNEDFEKQYHHLIIQELEKFFFINHS